MVTANFLLPFAGSQRLDPPLLGGSFLFNH